MIIKDLYIYIYKRNIVAIIAMSCLHAGKYYVAIVKSKTE